LEKVVEPHWKPGCGRPRQLNLPVPAVPFGISVVMNCHKMVIKRRRVGGVFLFTPVEELTQA